MYFRSTSVLFACVLILLTTSLVMVYSAGASIGARKDLQKTLSAEIAQRPEAAALDMTAHSPKFLQRQFGWAILGIAVLFLALNIDYETYKKVTPFFLAITAVLLVAVFIPMFSGGKIKGARRWIILGPIVLQPSELAKLAMVFFLAKFLTQQPARLAKFHLGPIPIMAMLAFFAILIFKEPDLGAVMMISCTAFVLMMVGGIRIRHIAIMLLLAAGAGIYELTAKSYRVQRLMAFWNPEDNLQEKGWQLHQSLVAISTGGLFGKGIGGSIQKYDFLSEAHTDFIYAIICEELGLIGAMGILAVYLLFFMTGLRVAKKAPDQYGALLATGITCMVGIQALFNIFVVTGMLPTKGLTLPLVSYGGSSLVITCFAVGILLNISKEGEAAELAFHRREFVPSPA